MLRACFGHRKQKNEKPRKHESQGQNVSNIATQDAPTEQDMNRVEAQDEIESIKGNLMENMTIDDEIASLTDIGEKSQEEMWRKRNGEKFKVAKSSEFLETCLEMDRRRYMAFRGMVQQKSETAEELVEKHFTVFFNRLQEWQLGFMHEKTPAHLSKICQNVRRIMKEHKQVLNKKQRNKTKRKQKAESRAEKYTFDYQYLAHLQNQKPLPFPQPDPLPPWGFQNPENRIEEECWACGRDNDEEEDKSSEEELSAAAVALEEKLDIEENFFQSLDGQIGKLKL